MPTLYTIGHSNHSLQDFLALLKVYHITHVVDVRSIPKSRHVPWFNQSRLKQSLKRHGITYLHLPLLGGLRSRHKNSLNQGWHNASFQAYADYMQTPEFFVGLKQLNALLKKGNRVTMMCAEILPWRCHRSLIGDAELVRGIKVLDIMNQTHVREQQLTEFAVVDRKKRPIQITYPK